MLKRYLPNEIYNAIARYLNYAEINEIRDAEQMNSNLFGSTTGYDSENYDAINHPNGVRIISVEGLNAYQGSDYKVYTFSPDSSIVINQTVTFK